MNTRKTAVIIALLLCCVTALAAPQGAMAAFTAACTPIGNRADVSFKVGGADQAVVSAMSSTLTVGNRVDHVVATTNGAAVSVATSQTSTLTFTITNNGNAYQQYRLSYVDFATSSTPSVFGGDKTDSFDASSVTTRVASAVTTTTAVVAPNASLTVTIVGTMPSSLTENWYDVLALKAQAVNPTTGALESNTSSGISNDGSSTPACTTDIVLGDGTGSDDSSRDGIQSARSAYIVHLTTLTISKSSIVYWDPFNNYSSPKAIPGAIIEYTVVVRNSGGSNTAQSVTISDGLSSNLTPTGVGSSWTSSAAGGSTSCTNRAVADVASGGWGCLGSTDFWSGAGAGATGTATIGDLATGQTATILFQATIN